MPTNSRKHIANLTSFSTQGQLNIQAPPVVSGGKSVRIGYENPLNTLHQVFEVDTQLQTEAKYSVHIYGVMQENNNHHFIDQFFYVSSTEFQEGLYSQSSPLLNFNRDGNKFSGIIPSVPYTVSYGLTIVITPITLVYQNFTINVISEGNKQIVYIS